MVDVIKKDWELNEIFYLQLNSMNDQEIKAMQNHYIDLVIFFFFYDNGVDQDNSISYKYIIGESFAFECIVFIYLFDKTNL